jgi:hypothetical protein
MRLAALPLLVLVAACSREEPAPKASPTPTPTVAAPRTLIAADFDETTLGAHVADMAVADEPVGNPRQPLATITGYVACAQDVTVCDPAQLPAGTIYTYVLTITPSAPPPSPTPHPDDTASPTPGVATPVEAPAELFRTIQPAPEFNGAIGFSKAEALAALGKDDAMTVTLDQKNLIWRVTEGSGWKPGLPITLWWQTTRAPAKPTASYSLEYGGMRADAVAPFPSDQALDRGTPRR